MVACGAHRHLEECDANDTGIGPARAIYTPVKAFAVIAMATTMLTAASGPARAFTPQLQEMFEQFVACKLLLITDPDAHSRECLGDGTGPLPPFNSLSTLGPAKRAAAEAGG